VGSLSDIFKSPPAHEAFWKEIQGLVKDGFAHTFRPVGCTMEQINALHELRKRMQAQNQAEAAGREPCYYCGGTTDAHADDPGQYPLFFAHAAAPGTPKAHHTSCVTQRLEP